MLTRKCLFGHLAVVLMKKIWSRYGITMAYFKLEIELTNFHVNIHKVSIAVFLFLLLVYAWSVMRRDKGRFPPGPKPVPLLGNLHQLPMDYQHIKFAEWGKQYGDVSFAHLFHTPTLILNSLQAAQDLMDKRSAKYSDRPRFVLMSELMGWDCVLSTMGYGDRCRKHRKWIHEAFQAKPVLESYYPLQRRESSVLLSGLLESPEAYIAHFRRFASALVLEIAYGHRVTSLEDKYLRVAERATTATAEAGSPGSMLVDFFPFLKELPAWFPGCGFKRQALDVRPHIRVFLDMPFQMVKDAMATGITIPSMTATLIEKCSGNEGISEEDEEDIKGTAGVLYGAGTETMVTALTTFVMAMVLYPNVLKKAREEIDRVIGNERLPDFTDRDSLPYLGCILKELYRWNSPLPLGQAFGDSSLWLAMAHMIATLDIRKSVDNFGKEINFEAAFSPGFTSAPKPFTCVILPRNKKACELVQSVNADFAH
ncbi:O-methylsterigmatocystin oxidoreductase [Grifola frondosa]|uniref:O-methylsterigmatocystin oxidoreductase n=1 Tax=Grifola frondosa TaxID=5627 RepID=A0A1C7MNQ5_GRIFR|nr:O-methylsterigmatocystin oxidoreductase [Grifola frondosa]